MREDLIRGAFSFFAAAVTLTMAAEYLELFVKTRRHEALLIGGICLGLSVFEASKVLHRVSRLLGLE